MAQKENTLKTKKEIGPLLIEQVMSLSRERGLGIDIVLSAIEKALSKVFESKYGHDHPIRVSLTKDGTIRTFLTVPVVQNDSDENDHDASTHTQETIEREEDLPFPEFDRLSIKLLRQVLNQSLKAADRSIFYEEFKDRVGHIVSGTVRQVSRDMITVGLGRAEAVMMRKDMIQGENFSVGSRVKFCIDDVKKDGHGPQILLSRASNKFLEGIMSQEIPEIQDGIIKIYSVARDPGSRSKVAVFGDVGRSDIVGACIGARGNRIRAVSEELCGEKIDVLMWSSDLPSFVVNALNPAEISKVVVEEEGHVCVVVPQNQLGIAIGRGGQNVRLAHHLTGINIDIVTEDQYHEKKEQAKNKAVNTLMEALDLDNMMALLLVSEGFESVADLLDGVREEDLASLPGMNIDIAKELQSRAKEAIASLQKNAIASFLEQGGDQALIDLGVPFQILAPLSANHILCVKDFAGLSIEDLFDCIGDLKLLCTEEVWGHLIMKGRNLDG